MIKQKLLSLFVALVATTALWASNTITYTATKKLTRSSLNIGQTTFGPAITSHTFSNDMGTITCSGDITTIGNYAFYDCSGLTSITIPNSVITIGDHAFGGCSGLPVENGLRYADTYLVEAVDKTQSTYTIKDGTKWIGVNAFSGCSGLTSVTIPNSVTTIGDMAFYGCSGLTSIEIPNSVTTIGYMAFMICENLTSVTIGNSVKTIGDHAFSGCSGLTSVTIGNSVKTIGNYAFGGCSGLTSVTIPNSVKTIGNYAFGGCSGLTSPVYNANCFAYMPTSYQGAYTIPNGIQQIAGSAFNNCSGLTSVTIPNSVTTIEQDAFYGCSGLTSVTIPNSVTTIGDYAFSHCSGLTSVTIPSSVTTIGDYAFSDCSGLTSVTIPNSVTTIGDHAFGGCSGLTSVTIPNSVTTIGDYAFSGCSGLTSVTIPNSVTTIGNWAFYNCTGLTSVTIPHSVTTIGNYAFFYVNNIVYNGTATGSPWGAKCVNGYVDGYLVYSDNTKTTLCGCSTAATGEITIPNSVTTIGNYAFYQCSGLTSATIPNSVTKIGYDAFRDCSGLTSITIPNSVTTIGSYAFYNVNNIVYSGTATGSPWGAKCVNGYVDGYLVYSDVTKTTLCGCSAAATGAIIIPSSVTTIEYGAFSGCDGLTSVTIPNSVTTIGSYAFSNCSGLTSPVYNANCFAYMPTSYQGAYTIPNGIQQIAGGAFSDCSGLTSVTIPNSVTTIGDNAFDGCSVLTLVTIGNSVTKIGSSAFSGCSGLKKTNYTGTIADWCKIKFSGSASNPIYYSKNFFINDVEVKDLVIPEGVDTIGDYAFYNCTGLTSVTIGNSVTTIGDMAFEDCSGLTSVTIPNSVTTIGDMAFEDCSGLTSVTIPNSVTTIGNYAFINVLNIVYSGAATGSPWGAKNFNGYVDGYLVYSDASKTKLCGCSSAATGAITIPNSVTTIGNSAFEGCNRLNTISYFNYALKEQLINTVLSTTQIIYRGVYLETFETSPTVIIMRNTANTDKKVISAWGVKANGNIYPADNAGEILFTGLQPATTYKLVQCVQLAGETEWQEQSFNTKTITTPALTLTTLVPKVVSAGTAIVAASTNISDYETNVGFEWRKDNTPAGAASKSGAAIICNGVMEGRLLNLGTDWWKVRPYYEAADGTRYYGEWEYIDPTDASYFEPTVHTYAMATSPTSNKTQVRGYVMTGTDDVTEQGFEYWFKGAKAPARMLASVATATPDSVYRVQASGQVMTAVLEDLAYSTTYTCRAYAVAGGKTYYGEEVQFLTPEDPRPIYTLYVMAGENGSVNTDVSGQYREGETVTLTAIAEDGFRFMQWNDGNTDNPRQLTITADTELVAIFELADGLEGLTIDNAQCTVKKFIHNNQLFIRRGNKIYNAAGRKVK